ncbi:hypothetical protein [Pseudomonas sp. NPDC090208]|uniref:hypothetical protein n=1 Tax=Pseudomonas sp. NPDC090208 TaxID=3364478 RepID=UPI003828867B
MRKKYKLDRGSYDNDADFHRAVDIAANALPTSEEKVQLMFALMRPCRGCGAEATGEQLAIKANVLHCTSCQHGISLAVHGGVSFGRIVTDWNDSTLTIEAAANV